MVSEGKSQSYTQDNLHLNVKLLPTLVKKLFTKNNYENPYSNYFEYVYFIVLI